jgi:hypothetical protein
VDVYCTFPSPSADIIAEAQLLALLECLLDTCYH